MVRPDAVAAGDDTAGSDDEDGVIFNGPLTVGGPANVTVTASVAGKLDAWIDFNSDGDWNDAGEKIFDSRSLIAGANALSFAVPANAPAAEQTFARSAFRPSEVWKRLAPRLTAKSKTMPFALLFLGSLQLPGTIRCTSDSVPIRQRWKSTTATRMPRARC